MKSVMPMSVIQTATEPMEAAFQDKRITLSIDAPPELPEVWADPSRIHLVLTNFLSNALRFTPTGGEVHVGEVEALDPGEVPLLRREVVERDLLLPE